jgi:hypothetical protein
MPEIQYLQASISEEQRREFGRLVETTVSGVEKAQFPAHSGISSELQIPHIQFDSRLGEDTETNLLALCATCHNQLHDRSI